jgi:chemotaxis methyl-accepting protein methylase
MIEVKRTHDAFYLKEKPQKQPKEYFKFLVSITRPLLTENEKPLNILDIGCATGGFFV